MENGPIKLMKWHRCDPLEQFSQKLLGKVGEIIPCRFMPGGGPFTVFVEGKEQQHIADLSLVQAKDASKGPAWQRLILFVKSAFFRGEQRSVLQVRRDPDPSCLVETYSLYIRVNDCPEIEQMVVDVSEELKGQFKGGIFVYSEFSQPEASTAK